MGELENFPSCEADARSLVERQTRFVLSHPGMTTWLKETLRGALEQDPVHILNELEILNSILRMRAQIVIDSAFDG